MSLQLSSFSQPVQTMLADFTKVPLPLIRTAGGASQENQHLLVASAQNLFPSARFPEEARSGLLLRLGCWEQSHQVSQGLTTAEGSYWHGIAHRLELDYANAAYWFRRVGRHAIFPQLRSEASRILATEGPRSWHLKENWNPVLFNAWCEEANNTPGSAEERTATLIQDAEWQLLFQWCGSNLGTISTLAW